MLHKPRKELRDFYWKNLRASNGAQGSVTYKTCSFNAEEINFVSSFLMTPGSQNASNDVTAFVLNGTENMSKHIRGLFKRI